MAEDEDDYLSDKFLVNAKAATSSSTDTYSARRKEAERRAQLKQEQNRLKTRRQRELESREAGLSKSLFERAKEEEETIGKGNKALAMMTKMGFKPGQALGQAADDGEPTSITTSRTTSNTPELQVKHDSTEKSRDSTPVESEPARGGLGSSARHGHIIVPLPLNEWAGKKGIGSLKRPPSPTSVQRVVKIAKVEEETSRETFRSRAREDYLERRAEGRLVPAQLTCVTLDEKAGKTFNVLWLNPNNPDAFPEDLADALAGDPRVASARRRHEDETFETRLRRQMQADALQPLSTDDEPDMPTEKSASRQKKELSPEALEEAMYFLRFSAQQRLQAVLAYLREEYSYCFWCGTQYTDAEDMQQNCPGEDEDEHD